MRLAILFTSALASQVPLDIGWRSSAAPHAPCAFAPLPAASCLRMTGPAMQTAWRVPDAVGADACAAAACAANARAYSFNASSCWVGDASKIEIATPGCVGFASFARAGAPASAVSLDFGWRAAPAAQAPCNFNKLSAGHCLRISPPLHDGSSWSVPAADSAACAAAACAARENAFSFNGTCWIGDSSRLSSGAPECAGFESGIAPGGSAWPPLAPPEAARNFDDVAWSVVDLPHDASADAPHEYPGPGGQGFTAPVSTYYRKHFRLDAAWSTSAITVLLPGAATSHAWWINGVPLAPRSDSGYLPILLALTGAGAPPSLNLSFGFAGADNVLVCWTSNQARTGWWAEGQGLTRGGAQLIVSSAAGALAPDGVAAPSFVDGAVHARATTAEGVWADAVRVTPAADVVLAAAGAVSLMWTLSDATGAVVGTANASSRVPAGASTVAANAGALLVTAAELWSVARPYLYKLRTELAVGGVLVDARDDVIGLRDIAWTGDAGLAVNGQAVKMRGYCDHATWGGVGAAVPPRVDLLRLQQLRGVGGNSLRTSHGPPAPQVLDLADRLGVLVLDENRALAHLGNVRDGAECGPAGCKDLPLYAGDIVADAAALAHRDRLHASVIWFSICNELGCGPGTLLADDVVLSVKEAMVAVDASRAISGNLGWQGPNATRPRQPFDDVVDVVGMSHQSAATLGAFHAASPYKPLAMTECCSCETMRGADADLPMNTSVVFYSSEASACLAAQTQVSNAPAYCAGTFVWTLHDVRQRIAPPNGMCSLTQH